MKEPRTGRGGRDLTTGPIASTLLFFALPVLGANVLQSMNGSVNAVFVGRFLGETALAATSNANLVLFLLLGTMFGLGMASTILVAQAFGARDVAEARRVVGTGATFFLLLSVVFSTGGWILTNEILVLLGTPEDALPLARDYLRILFVAGPAMNLMAFLMSILRGAGDSRTPFIFMILSVIIDIALNPFLITGWGPFPELGIKGAALSTLIAQAVSLPALVILLYRRGHPLALKGADLALLRPHPALLKIIVLKGIPMGLQMIVVSLSALLLMGLVNTLGSQTAAAYGVAAQLWTYVQMPALAIGAAVSSMAAQNVGARKWDRIGRITWSGIGFNLILTGALVVVLFLFDRPILGLFLAGSQEAIETAVHINTLASWSFVLFGITIVIFATVRANGAVMPPLIILAISLLLIRTSFAYGAREWLGADALWWSFPVGSVCSLVLAISYFRFGGWRNIHMRETLPAAPEARSPDPAETPPLP